jgi:hypothetical protein
MRARDSGDTSTGAGDLHLVDCPMTSAPRKLPSGQAEQRHLPPPGSGS